MWILTKYPKTSAEVRSADARKRRVLKTGSILMSFGLRSASGFIEIRGSVGFGC